MFEMSEEVSKNENKNVTVDQGEGGFSFYFMFIHIKSREGWKVKNGQICVTSPNFIQIIISEKFSVKFLRIYYL